MRYRESNAGEGEMCGGIDGLNRMRENGCLSRIRGVLVLSDNVPSK